MNGNWSRCLWLLAGSLLLAGAHVYLSFRGVGSQLIARETLVAAADGPAVSGIRVRRPEARAFALARGSGGGWRLVAPYAAAADAAAVARLKDALTLAPVLRTYGDGELARFGRVRADYGLDAGAVEVTVDLESGESRSIRIGDPTPDGQGVFADCDREPVLYVVPAAVREAADRPPRDFRAREFCSLAPATVNGVDIKRGEGATVRLRREADGDWRAIVKGESARASRFMAGRLLEALAQARVEDFVWPVGATNEPQIATAPLLALYGLDGESAVTVTLRCADGADRQVVFGNAAKNGRVYALTAGAAAVATVDGRLRDLAANGDFADRRCFPFAPGAVRRVSVAEGERTYLLARRDDGSWRLDAPVVAGADAERAEALVAGILRLTDADVAADGMEVSVNSAAPVRVPRERLFRGFTPEELRERTVFAVSPVAVRRLAVDGEQCVDPASVVYDADRREWVVESARHAGGARPDAIAAALAALDPLQAARVVSLGASESDLHAYGLDRPAWRFAIDLSRAGELRRNLLVGARAPDGGYYAASGDRGTVFVLSGETIGRLTAGLIERE